MFDFFIYKLIGCMAVMSCFRAGAQGAVSCFRVGGQGVAAPGITLHLIWTAFNMDNNMHPTMQQLMLGMHPPQH